jgi:hypothetical protein
MYIIDNFLTFACRGYVGAKPATAADGNSPITPALGTTGPLQSFGITTTLMRTLEYTLLLSSPQNRQKLLRALVHPKAVVLEYIVECCRQVVLMPRSVTADVLCQNLRFLRAVLIAIGAPVPPGVASYHPPFLELSRALNDNANIESASLQQSSLSTDEEEARALTTQVIESIFVHHGLIGEMAKVYQRIGGLRKAGLFHSTFRSVLQLIVDAAATQPTPTVFGNAVPEAHKRHFTLCRDFIFLKHRAQLPEAVVQKLETSMLSEVVAKMTSPKIDGNETAAPRESTPKSPDIPRSSPLRAVSPGMSPHSHLSTRVVDEVSIPADARQMEDVAVFPAKLKHIIGRLSPQPSTQHRSLDDNIDASSANTKAEALLHRASSSSPPPGAASMSIPTWMATKTIGTTHGASKGDVCPQEEPIKVLAVPKETMSLAPLLLEEALKQSLPSPTCEVSPSTEGTTPSESFHQDRTALTPQSAGKQNSATPTAPKTLRGAGTGRNILRSSSGGIL